MKLSIIAVAAVMAMTSTTVLAADADTPAVGECWKATGAAFTPSVPCGTVPVVEVVEVEVEVVAMTEPVAAIPLTVELGGFAFDSAFLTPEIENSLNSIVAEINSRATSDTAEVAVLVGHTDSIGPDEYNMTLSMDRANAVQGYLVAAGVNAGNIVVAADGADAPVATNDTDGGRAENRRVTLIVK